MPFIDWPLKKLKTYKPKLTREKDFESFWKKNHAESKKQPLNPEFIKIDYPVKTLDVYKVFFDGFGGGRICGWFVSPKVSKNNPAILCVHGYSGGKGFVYDWIGWALQGYTIFSLDTRGQFGESQDHAKYPAGHFSGWMTQGILDPDTYYYKYVYMDGVRAIDLLETRKEVDPKRIGVMGASQGGGLSIAAAALAGKRIKTAMPDVPYLCHYRRAVEVATGNPYLELCNYMRFKPQDEERIFKTLSYFDGMNLAPMITAKTLVSVGLTDGICPPSTVFAAYNHMKCRKELAVYDYWAHEVLGPQNEKRVKWMAENL